MYCILWVTACGVAQDTTASSTRQARTEARLKAALSEVLSSAVKQNAKSGEDVTYALEIDGLVIDETKTKIGRDYYDLFFSKWEAPADAKAFTLFIRERAHPRFGSWVWVDLNENTVFQAVLRPNYEMIEEAVENSILAIKQKMSQSKQDAQQLAGEDMTGSGIY